MASTPSGASTIVVTGASSGIGLETARRLAQAGHQVVLACRDQERGQRALQEIKSGLPPEKADWQVHLILLNLESLPSIRNFAKMFEKQFEGIDVLINNAGVVYPQRRETANGVEAQLQVIYLGPFLLTELLRPRLRPGGRVINVVSELHRKVNLQDPKQLETTRYQFIQNFALAECAKIVWTYELARRLPAQRVAHCLHPGGVNTNLFRHLRPPASWLFRLSNLLKRSSRAGADTPVFLATDPAALESSGKYWIDKREAKSAPATHDRELARKLWYWSTQQLAE